MSTPSSPTPLLPAPQRTYADVRARIDGALGSGFGVPVDEAAGRLTGAEHAVWALDNLIACLAQDRFHIWDQSFCSGDYDGPRAIDSIAEAGRAVDPVVADLLRWSARWPRTRPVALVSVVPLVWQRKLDAALGFLHAVAERWDDSIQPLALPAPPPLSRPELEAEPGPVRFPSVAVGFSERGAGCEVRCPEEQLHREGVFCAAVWALWRAGASDAALDDFFEQYHGGDNDEVEVVSRWIRIDGDGGDPARVEALRWAVRGSSLARWLGAPEQPAHFFVRADEAAFDEVMALLETFHTVSLRGGDDAVASLMSALRQDPDVLVASAAALTDELVAELPRAVAVGTSLVLFGDAPAADRLAAAIAGVGPAVFDRRARSHR
jgi:hypothetical protein